MGPLKRPAMQSKTMDSLKVTVLLKLQNQHQYQAWDLALSDPMDLPYLPFEGSREKAGQISKNLVQSGFFEYIRSTLDRPWLSATFSWRNMKTSELSTCFCTNDVDACRDFYQRHFMAKITFDCGWYVNLSIGGDGPTIQFMQPQENMSTYGGKGVILNFKVDDVDAEHERLTAAGLQPAMPLEDHPWGDKGFAVMDPIGNSVYIYSDRTPSEEFKQYYKE